MKVKQDTHAPVQEKLAKAVCLFLAEMLRTRQVSLQRSVEIAKVIIKHLDEIKTELQFLSAVQGLERDFQELTHLRRDLLFYHHVDDRVRMEELAREYAISHLPDQPKEVVTIMEEALSSEMTLKELMSKHPKFADFVKLNEGRKKGYDGDN